MCSDFQGNTAKKWLSQDLNLNFNLSFFLQPMSCKVIFYARKKEKQYQDAECWWVTAFYLEKMQRKIKSMLKPKEGGHFCVHITNPSG